MSEPAQANFDIEQVEIRPATDADQPAISKLYREGFEEGQLRSNDTGADIENLRAGYFSDDGQSGFWVACHDGKVIGMIGVQRTSNNVGEMRRLRVHSDYRRRGVGTRLMEHAMQFCQDQGYLKVVLDVRVEREPAIKLFEKFGFTLSRSRDVDGRKMLDFYLDLYREPEA